MSADTQTSQAPTEIDEARVEQFIGQVLTDLGATTNTALVRIGDELGLYRALAADGPATSVELAERTSTSERYVREWLHAQAAGGYVDYDPESTAYSLPPEHAVVLADDGPASLQGTFQSALAAMRATPALIEAFRTGAGVAWGEHDPELHAGADRHFGTQYRTHLTTDWIPAVEGLEGRLLAGARVADVGCGHGTSTITMARAFPASTFTGFDYHAPSVESARRAAAAAGVDDRTRFEAVRATEIPTAGYDVVTILYALHDMGDPVGVCRRAREALAPGGTMLLVEPEAGDRVEENFNPAGRFSYGMSTLGCVPSALSQDVGCALGHQAGEARLREVATEAGFGRFRRVAQTPAEAVFEVRP